MVYSWIPAIITAMIIGGTHFINSLWPKVGRAMRLPAEGFSIMACIVLTLALKLFVFYCFGIS